MVIHNHVLFLLRIVLFLVCLDHFFSKTSAYIFYLFADGWLLHGVIVLHLAVMASRIEVFLAKHSRLTEKLK